MTLPVEIAPGVAYMTIGSFVNVYFVGAIGGPWTLVDTGLTGFGGKIVAAAEKRYGANARPEAIVLTHGHPDHSGAAQALAQKWNVPIYAHPLELPYLTGKSAYPPYDPTVGGFIALMARFMPNQAVRVDAALVRELPDDGTVPGMPDWKWQPTPGHSPGHVSFWRESDKTLLAGDAFTTVDVDSLLGVLSKRQIIGRPPAPFTCDWQAAEFSVGHLATLAPEVIAAGHGIPMSGREATALLERFADNFPIPSHGRYIPEPAHTNVLGIQSLPVRAPDPVGKLLIVGGFGLLAGLLAMKVLSGRRDSGEDYE